MKGSKDILMVTYNQLFKINIAQISQTFTENRNCFERSKPMNYLSLIRSICVFCEYCAKQICEFFEFREFCVKQLLVGCGE